METLRSILSSMLVGPVLFLSLSTAGKSRVLLLQIAGIKFDGAAK
jgi:hypothetical protein